MAFDPLEAIQNFFPLFVHNIPYGGMLSIIEAPVNIFFMDLFLAGTLDKMMIVIIFGGINLFLRFQ